MVFVKEQRKLKSFGSPLPRWLEVRNKDVNLFSFSKEGTFPYSLLSPISNHFRFVALDIESRIDPVNWLVAKINTSKFGRVIPMSNGRDPWI